jgi:Ca2+-binding RTX toxin-like protein
MTAALVTLVDPSSTAAGVSNLPLFPANDGGVFAAGTSNAAGTSATATITSGGVSYTLTYGGTGLVATATDVAGVVTSISLAKTLAPTIVVASLVLPVGIAMPSAKASTNKTFLTGNDTINGSGGSDKIYGGGGSNETITAGAGNDTIVFLPDHNFAGEVISGGTTTTVGVINTEIDAVVVTPYFGSAAVTVDLRSAKLLEIEAIGLGSNVSMTLGSNQIAAGLLAPDFTYYPSGGGRTSLTVVDSSPAVATTINLRTVKYDFSLSTAFNTFIVDASAATANTVILSPLNTSAFQGKPSVKLLGGSGADTIMAGTGDTRIIGGLGGDTLSGNVGNDTLLGDGTVMLTEAAASIKRLYLATLARGPDDVGWQGWVDALAGGSSLATITSGFVNSAEFYSVYGARDNTQFVTLLYNNVLHRAPDAGGLAGWLGVLNGGGSRESVVNGFSESGEFQANTNPTPHAGQVYRLYGATLDRTPDAGGFTGWVDALDGTSALNGVAGGFVGSAEFQAKYGALDNTAFVNLLYMNVLHRAADAGGLQGWLDALSSGTSRTGVVLGFSESAEYTNSTAAAFKSYMNTVHSDWNDIIEGGAGDDILSGGHGADTYVFRATEVGIDQVYQFESWDTLQFVGFGYADKAAGLSHLTQSGANVVFADKGETITFHGTSLGDVQAATWLLG